MKLQTKVAWGWGLMVTGAVGGMLAALAINDERDLIGPFLAAAATFGAGVLFFRSAGTMMMPPATGAPSFGQGCVMVIGGVVLGFFTCVGAIIAGSGGRYTARGFIVGLCVVASLGMYCVAAAGALRLISWAFASRSSDAPPRHREDMEDRP